jgi:hypothetical protein
VLRICRTGPASSSGRPSCSSSPTRSREPRQREAYEQSRRADAAHARTWANAIVSRGAAPGRAGRALRRLCDSRRRTGDSIEQSCVLVAAGWMAAARWPANRWAIVGEYGRELRSYTGNRGPVWLPPSSREIPQPASKSITGRDRALHFGHAAATDSGLFPLFLRPIGGGSQC